jgi:hypothetical protein
MTGIGRFTKYGKRAGGRTTNPGRVMSVPGHRDDIADNETSSHDKELR